MQEINLLDHAWLCAYVHPADGWMAAAVLDFDQGWGRKVRAPRKHGAG